MNKKELLKNNTNIKNEILKCKDIEILRSLALSFNNDVRKDIKRMRK